MEQKAVCMNNTTPSFSVLLQKFFLERMMSQRNVSLQTVKSYRDTFRLFIKFMAADYRITPAAVRIEHLEAVYILSFLDSLEKKRRNQPKTINNRLAAIHSFLRFLSFEVPEYSGLIEKSLLIPFRKEEKRQMDFLTKEEFNALAAVCDNRTGSGRRDTLMLLLLYNTGARVSELTALKGKDIIVENTKVCIHITGKGRKERTVPLWQNTSKYLLQYIKQYSVTENGKLFMNYAGRELTRSGVRYRISCLVKKASSAMPSLNMKDVTPHTFRHTTALHMLQAGIDISTIAIWLGHESIETTHKYMEADIEMKRRALEKIEEPGNYSCRFRPDKSVLFFLNSL
jgi:integrase/recombinase XerD